MARIIKAQELKGGGGEAATVLKLPDFAEDGRVMVLDPGKDAAEAAADARRKAEEAQREASEQGYAEGLARGRNDGYADGERQALKEHSQRLAGESAELTRLGRNAINALGSAREEILHRARCEMLDFALMLAEKIVGRVAVTDISAAKANLTKVLELTQQNSDITVQVNPDQLRRLRKQLRDLVDVLRMEGNVRLVADEGVSPGGVKVLTGGGQIDATIETQLDNVVAGLLGRQAPPRKSRNYVSSGKKRRRKSPRKSKP